MSDDLISRKSLIENLNKCAPEHYTALVNDLIMKEQTAFDKEKVIEELKSPYNYAIMAGKHVTTVDRSVEIVEKGGIE